MKRVIDLVSIGSAVSALERGRDKQWEKWTPWDKYTLAQVTLSLILDPTIQITSRGEKRGGLLGKALKTLSEDGFGQVNVKAPMIGEIADQAVGATRGWAEQQRDVAKSALTKVMSDVSFHPWIEWFIRCTWEDTVKQEGSLIDDRFESQINGILNLSSTASEALKADAANKYLVSNWANRPLQAPPEEILQAFVLSALLRGRLIEDYLSRTNEHYAFHPMREPVLRSIEAEGLQGKPIVLSARRLAAIIVSSAICHRAVEDSIGSWAHNIRLVRRAIHFERAIHFSADQPGAVDQAIRIAQQLGLQIEWQLARRIHDRIAIDAGFDCLSDFVFAPLGEPTSVIAKWSVIKWLGPGWKLLSDAVAEALQRSHHNLKSLADTSDERPGKIFAGTIDH